MVRSYARLLKLDPEPLVGRMAGRVAVRDNAEAVASVQRPIPIRDSARRTNFAYAALSIIFLVVIAGVAVQWQHERSDTGKMTFVDAAQKAPAPAPSAPVAAETERTELASTVTPSLAQPTPSAETRPASADLQPLTAGKRRIALRFEQESWVQIRNRDGRILTSELNAAGTERIVDGLPPFDLVIGNAQYVRLSYDDKPVDLAPHVKVEVARFTLN
jgi:cytoskeleton protein RodZ